MSAVTVLGTGAWGTTFAGVLADAGTEVLMWGIDKDAIEEINTLHTNEAFIGGRDLPETIKATEDAEEALAGAELIFLVLPAQSMRMIVADFAGFLPSEAIVTSLMKGIEVGTHLRMSEVLGEVWGIDEDHLAVVSGPNLAKEIALKQPTATVVASRSEVAAQAVADAMASWYFRPYTNSDVVGVELCGAYKNVIAVGAGIADGRGFGNNTTATIITRGLAEIQRLGLVIGAAPDTFSGLAGVGDLIATCASPLSRNHTLGGLIGKGISVKEAISRIEGTAEGAQTSLSIQQLARMVEVEVPICDAVVAMLHEGKDPEKVMAALLARPRKAEGE
ncbi:MAG: NAD(P)-dependent glycerol-3-phosphate dehydrogenase [Demequinaceae bacterium]|nr:NAD(P)-dependent glycerol-3-phosphate dehydrogenase [Demequinaceae bacterium]